MNQQVFPKQRVSRSEKSSEEWRKACIDGVIAKSMSNVLDGRTSPEHKRSNYEMVNSKVNRGEYRSVTNPTNSQFDNTPEDIEGFNIIRSKFALLIGEEIKRPANYFVYAVNSTVVKEKYDRARDLVNQWYENQWLKETGQDHDPELAKKNPEKIQEQALSSYQNDQEQMAQQALNYLKYQLSLDRKFKLGFEHALIGGEEIYYVGVRGTNPDARVVNTVYFDWEKSPEVRYVQDADWCKEDRWLPLSAIADEFLLDDDEWGQLESARAGINYGAELPSMWMHPNGDTSMGLGYGPGLHQSFSNMAAESYDGDYIQVSHVCWRSFRKVGFLHFFDADGEQQSEVVDESFKLRREELKAGWFINWRWLPEVWTGTRIGHCLYKNVGPLPGQRFSYDNPMRAPLPYYGCAYNDLNCTPTSFADLLRPHQKAYNTLWWRLRQEFAKAKGKKLMLDVSQLPKGWKLDRWFHYFDQMGIGFINSAQDGRPGQGARNAAYNQWAAIDLSLSTNINGYLAAMQKIESLVDNITGITPQREGAMASTETVGGIERSVVQSSHITEPFFFEHNIVKEMVCTALVETAKVAWPKGKYEQYPISDKAMAIMMVEGGKFQSADYGVYMTTSSRDYQLLEKLRGLAMTAMQNQMATLSDIIDIYQTNSVSEAANMIKDREAKAQQAQSESQQAAAQAAKEEKDWMRDFQERKFQYEQDRDNKDREADLEESVNKGMGYARNNDLNMNQVPDMLEIQKLKNQTALVQNTVTKTREEILMKRAGLQLKLNQGKAPATT